MKKYLILLIIFALIEIGLALYLTVWREHFWQAISNKQQLQFMQQLGIFTIVAVVMCVLSGISGYLLNLTAIKWREKLNKECHNQYLCAECAHLDKDCNNCGGRGYTSIVLDNKSENLPQRIEADCREYPALLLNIVFGAVKSIVYCVVFITSMLYLFSFWYVGVLLCYVAIGQVITYFIAKPLISLNYQSQRVEATYRNSLTINNFNDCVRIMLGLAKKQKHLTYAQTLYNQIGVIVPLILIAPVYFTTGMTFGMLMRFNSVASTILENMSYVIDSFDQINRFLSCKKRLKEIGVI